MKLQTITTLIFTQAVGICFAMESLLNEIPNRTSETRRQIQKPTEERCVGSISKNVQGSVQNYSGGFMEYTGNYDRAHRGYKSQKYAQQHFTPIQILLTVIQQGTPLSQDGSLLFEAAEREDNPNHLIAQRTTRQTEQQINFEYSSSRTGEHQSQLLNSNSSTSQQVIEGMDCLPVQPSLKIDQSPTYKEAMKQQPKRKANYLNNLKSNRNDRSGPALNAGMFRQSSASQIEENEIEIIHEHILHKPPCTDLKVITDQPSSSKQSSRHAVINPKSTAKMNSSTSYINHVAEAESFIRQAESFIKKWQYNTLNDTNRMLLRNRKNIILCKLRSDEDIAKADVARSIILAKYINDANPMDSIWKVVLEAPLIPEEKYAEFLTIHKNSTLYSTKLKQFIGSYPLFFKDLAEYMKENISRVYINYNNTQIRPDPQKYRLGDIYIQNTFDLEGIQASVKKSKGISGDFLASKILLIMNLPEVYRDLHYMPPQVFKQIIDSMQELEYNSSTKRKVIIIKCLYRAATSKALLFTDPEYSSLSTMLFNAFKELATENDKNVQNYTTEEIYAEAYKAMSHFYRHAPYRYAKQEEENAFLEIVGKDVIVEQKYKRCEATITINSTKTTLHKCTLRSVIYYDEVNKWNTSAEIPNHYHVQFVDNYLQTVSRVCLPVCKREKSQGHHYIHTLEEIMEYLGEVYSIENKSFIYALKAIKGTRGWSLISDNDKKKTIQEISSIEHYSVVFYYIKEGLKNSHFTLATFTGPEIQKDHIMEIPLFLSPLMQAVVHLGPYKALHLSGIKIQIRKLQNKFIIPQVYNYSLPAVETKMKFNDVSKYYSSFYVDSDIYEHKADCYNLYTTIEHLGNSSHKITWYVKMPSDTEQYTHYIFKNENTNGSEIPRNIVQNIKETSTFNNKLVYGWYTVKNQNILSEPFFCRELSTFITKNEQPCIEPNTSTIPNNFIVFKNINLTKVNLHLHNEILRVLLSHRLYLEDGKVPK